MAYHLQHIQTEEDTSMKWLYLTGVSSRKRERERIVYLKLVFSSKVILMPESIACFNNDESTFISMIKYQMQSIQNSKNSSILEMGNT